MMDQVRGLADIVSIGSKATKEGRHVEIKLAAMMSPGLAAELMDMQDNGKVLFQFERAVRQQRLPLAEVRPDDVPGQVNLFKTCPECGNKMERTSSGLFACPGCGMVEITGGNEGAGTSEASEDGQADEGEEEAEEEPPCGPPQDGEPIRKNESDLILHCSVGDVIYMDTIPELTDRELLYCLAKEERTSGRVQLKREIRRRLRDRASGQHLHPEETALLRAALKKSGPEEASGDGRPLRPAAEEEKSAAPAPASDGQVLCIKSYYCELCDKLTAQNLILTSSGQGVWRCSICGATWLARERDVQEAQADGRPFRPAAGE